MTERNLKNSMTEEAIVAKVTELMVTLDEIKKYNELAKHFKIVSLIIIVSIAGLVFTRILLPFTNLLSAFDPAQSR